MIEADYKEPEEHTISAIGRLLREKYPDLETGEYEAFLALLQKLDAREQVSATPGDVFLLKLLCETLFRDAIVERVLTKRASPDWTAKSPVDN